MFLGEEISGVGLGLIGVGALSVGTLVATPIIVKKMADKAAREYAETDEFAQRVSLIAAETVKSMTKDMVKTIAKDAGEQVIAQLAKDKAEAQAKTDGKKV